MRLKLHARKLNELKESKVKIDESEYKNWTQRHVLVWLKGNFVNNGFDEEMIKPFLYEFNRKFNYKWQNII